MRGDLIILESAHRHGVSEEGMLHAFANPVRTFVQEDGMTMIIGPDGDGTLIEIGVLAWHGTTVIAHAMRPARTKYLR